MTFTLLAKDLCTITPSISNDNKLLSIFFSIEPDSYIYENSISAKLQDGSSLTKYGGDLPNSSPQLDSPVFDKNFTLIYSLPQNTPFPLSFSIEYQGCKNDICLLPASKSFTLNANSVSAEPDVKNHGNSILLHDFDILGNNGGFISTNDFIEWADLAEQGNIQQTNNPLLLIFNKFGIWLAMFMLVPLGILLNLTPCVLPMIPINLAIIGAGGKNNSKWQGLTRGLIYGMGMAVSYGILGLVTVLTGSRFGAINSSPWFNWGIALVFIILSLAMFDIFSIDFTKWRKGGKAGNTAGIFILGAVAAILAGACVAPVLIWALLLATDLYSQGRSIGLALPFILGIGMALPWPVLGAGMAKIPKPGMWMIRIRQALAILILAFAVYYAWSGFKLLSNSSRSTKEGWHNTLQEAIDDAKINHKPLFIEFWGLSCKSCEAMDKMTFPDKKVIQRMENWSKVAIQADAKDNSVTAALVKELNIVGVPTCVIAKPHANNK